MVERAVWQLPGFPVAGAGAVNRSGDDVQDLAVGLECRRCSLENSRGTVERTAGEKYCDTRHGKSERKHEFPRDSRRRDRSGGVSAPHSGTLEDVVPVRRHRRKRMNAGKRLRDPRFEIVHGTTSVYERLSAACAVASVADTVPTSTSRAAAIDR